MENKFVLRAENFSQNKNICRQKTCWIIYEYIASPKWNRNKNCAQVWRITMVDFDEQQLPLHVMEWIRSIELDDKCCVGDDGSRENCFILCYENSCTECMSSLTEAFSVQVWHSGQTKCEFILIISTFSMDSAAYEYLDSKTESHNKPIKRNLICVFRLPFIAVDLRYFSFM